MSGVSCLALGKIMKTYDFRTDCMKIYILIYIFLLTREICVQGCE